MVDLSPLASIPNLNDVFLGGKFADVSPLASPPVQPSILSVTHDPLDSNALLTIDRLCQAGWAVTWDGGSCGYPCRINPYICAVGGP